MHSTTHSRAGFQLPDWRPLTEYEGIALKMFAACAVGFLINLLEIGQESASATTIIGALSYAYLMWNTWQVIAHYLNTRHDNQAAPLRVPVMSRGWMRLICTTTTLYALAFLASAFFG